MRLSELYTRAAKSDEYSYYIEVSEDGDEWQKVVDYSSQICRSWQNLYFDTVNVKFLKIVGCYLDGRISDIVIEWVDFKLVSDGPKFEEGFVIPDGDISSPETGAR